MTLLRHIVGKEVTGTNVEENPAPSKCILIWDILLGTN